jgi:alkylhydroperoxidase/carboxymuconolactone decarboxylase family protein YurZ
MVVDEDRSPPHLVSIDDVTRELLALGADVRGRDESGVAKRVAALARMGATRDDLQEALGAAVMKGGQRSLRYAIDALATFDAICSRKPVRESA